MVTNSRTASVWLKVATVIATIIIIGLYFAFDPLESQWMPQCAFHKITGLQCMGCGTQRMLHALLHGNFIDAFRANALVFLGLPLIGFFIFVEIKRIKNPGLYRIIHSRGVIIAVSVILFIWLILRNILGI